MGGGGGQAKTPLWLWLKTYKSLTLIKNHLCVIEILDNNDDERNYIEYYFHLGYKYEDIVNLLSTYHGISMSVRTLKRKLLKYGLQKKNVNIDEQELQSIIKKK